MKMNKWTLALAAVGLVSLSAQAEEAKLVPVLSTVSATTISGYVDTSAQWNPGTGNANPAPFAFNAGKQDGFNLNSVDLRISKAADETKWSAGYMVDLMFGPDAASVTGSTGTSANVRQAYVDLRAPIGTGLGIKVGRFDALMGYEVTDSFKNPNFTRSYGYTFEPTEHTGVVAHYNFCEYFAMDAGIANTVNTGEINARNVRGFDGTAIESKKAYLGLLTFTAPKCWGFLADDNLVLGIDQGPSSSPNEDQTHLYAGATLYTPLKGLNFGVAYDVIWHADAAGADLGYNTAVAGYVVYAPEKCKWSVAGRLEYAHGDLLDALSFLDNGGRSPGFGNGLGTPAGTEDRFHKVLALTGTITYDLWANVVSRLEARWDHALDASAPFGASNAAGTAGTQDNEVSLIANLVYKF